MLGIVCIVMMCFITIPHKKKEIHHSVKIDTTILLFYYTTKNTYIFNLIREY